MAKLIVQLIADFLRDDATVPNQFGEALRCAVLEDETVALQAYGLNQQQINVLVGRNRKDILQRISDEIGAVMDELDFGKPMLNVNYPGGGVHLRAASILFSAGNNRTLMFRGTGFDAGTTVSFAPKGGGAATAGAVQKTTCDKDVWQRLYVTVTLAAGTYTATVKRTNTAQDVTDVTFT
jgi:hypothetical protein